MFAATSQVSADGLVSAPISQVSAQRTGANLGHPRVRSGMTQGAARSGAEWALEWGTLALSTSFASFFHHQGLAREYSPWKTAFQVLPLSLDFSQVCSTLLGFN